MAKSVSCRAGFEHGQPAFPVERRTVENASVNPGQANDGIAAWLAPNQISVYSRRLAVFPSLPGRSNSGRGQREPLMDANGQSWSAVTCHRFGFRIPVCQKRRSCGGGSIGNKKAATSRRTPKSMRDTGRSVCGVQVTAACTRKTGRYQADVGQFELAPRPCSKTNKQTSWPGHDRIPIGTARTPRPKAMSDHNAHDPPAHKATKRPIPAKGHLT
jgi:hypothetical protein